MSSTDPQNASSQSYGLTPSVLRRRARRRNLLVALVLLAGGAGAWYFLRGEEQGVSVEPLIATVEIGTIENTIAAAGSLKPRNFVDVGAQVSGQLQKLYVEVGDLVEGGQLLAEIDARVQQNRVEASRASIQAQEAQLDARRASLELARANAERQKRLMEADATSQQDYDTAMTNLTSAGSNLIQQEKQIEQSRASLSSDETQLEFTRIYAPTAGTVVSIEMNEGRTLNANQQAPTILRIADLSTMTVETEISEADIGNVNKGMQVYFTTLGGGERRWYGELRQIRPTPVVENNVVLYTGLFDVDNQDATLLPEMTAQVYFVTSSAEDVLTVPMGALTFNEAAGPAGGPAAARRFPGDPAANGARGGFTPPQGFTRPGAAGATARQAGQGGGTGAGRRLASVQVMSDDGSMSQREVIVGVTSRIAAEVISGLKAGDRVVAGILQASAPGQNSDEGRDMRGAMRAFR